MKFLPFAFLVATLLAVPSRASWGSDGCGPVGPGSPSAAPGYQWRPTQGVREVGLYRDNVQIGAVRLSDRLYFARPEPGVWYGPCEPPVALPPNLCQCPDGCNCPDPTDCHCPKATPAAGANLPPDGVQADKVEANKHCVNGRQCSKEELIAAIKKAAIPTDQNKLRLTIIGPADLTAPVAKDIAGLPEASQYLVKEYTPDNWAVKDVGLTGGHAFSIVLQSPDGKELHRQSDYQGGIAALAEALREGSAGYDPGKTPDLRSHDPIEVLKKYAAEVPTEVWVVGGVLVIFFFLSNRKVQS